MTTNTCDYSQKSACVKSALLDFTSGIIFRSASKAIRLLPRHPIIASAAFPRSTRSACVKSAFTLAEVLITLVIIGIIAAITVPMIIQNHKKVEVSAKLKKMYSNVINAVKLAETEQGMPITEWDWNNYRCDTNEKCQYIFKNYYGKYLIYDKIDDNASYFYDNDDNISDENFNAGIPTFSVYLNDGSILSVTCEYSDCLYFDVNGEKGPNMLGRDVFEYDLVSNKIGEVFSDCDTDVTRQELIESCKTGKNGGRYSCSCLVRRDGFEFKDDYPLRL